MTYSDLGATNIARVGGGERDFYASVARSRAIAAAPPVFRSPVVSYAPKMPVLTKAPPLVSKPYMPPAQPKAPQLILPKPSPTVKPTATMKPSGTPLLTRTADTVFTGLFSASPLPLILIGLGALFLFNQKGR